MHVNWWPQNWLRWRKSRIEGEMFQDMVSQKSLILSAPAQSDSLAQLSHLNWPLDHVECRIDKCFFIHFVIVRPRPWCQQWTNKKKKTAYLRHNRILKQCGLNQNAPCVAISKNLIHKFDGIIWSDTTDVPGLVLTNVAIQNGPVEIVDLPIKDGHFP